MSLFIPIFTMLYIFSPFVHIPVMKKILFAVLLAGAVACSKTEPSDDGERVPSIQKVTCEIVAPEEGTTIDLATTTRLVIKGDASVTRGKIELVELRVGGVVVPDVKTVPFEHSVLFTADQPLGPFAISLSVEGDEGGKASDLVTVIIEKTAEVPEPSEDEFLDPRDNTVYRTVTIGDQTWMAQNLAWLPSVHRPETAASCQGEPYQYVLNYDGEDVAAAKATEEYALYGVLYNWYAVVGEGNSAGVPSDAVPSGVQGPCPDGWHVPSQAEWQTLFDFVANELPPVKGNGMYIDLGLPGEEPYWEYEEGLKNVWSALAGLEGWGASSMTGENPDLEAGPRDTYGFGVVPSGQCWQTGTFGYSESNAVLWMPHAQEYGGATVSFTNLSYMPDFSKSGLQNARGYAVRCLKD